MKYINAADILPDELLKEVQKYAKGKAIYIPEGEKRKKWGAKSGARSFYEKRNQEIREKYNEENVSMDELARIYSLSLESIRKIIYK